MGENEIHKSNRIKWFLNKWYGNIIVSLLILFLAFTLCNNIIMPLYTRHGQAIAVPEVIAFSADAAKKILSHYGFKMVRGEFTYDAFYPPGFVLFQNPEAGAKVKKGRRVYVTISRGERVIAMPKLVDLNLSNAKHTLRSWELTLGDVELQYNSQFDDTIVVSQSVPEDAEVTIGSEIDLICKVRPVDKSTVPDMMGISLLDAEDKIKSAKLVLGEIIFQVTDQLLPMTVIDQNPEAGTETSIDDTVRLVVSKLPDSDESVIQDSTKYY